ncbi:cholesterol 25-hydroxylase-like protein 1, member 2 [Saccoglossus kowalevskii]|uniref:Cholesterol 25-hydroxylase-like protein 1, member 2-like n=1 Tax=Saccoglossus kowalevskii TaxID=10224 RepID=A0ABM0GLV8_SACKO|nr:PREDICTED: cholesterol 25-hydroxylase-like protein 1, member 2-like [Saccoglossus kowalevskii]
MALKTILNVSYVEPLIGLYPKQSLLQPMWDVILRFVSSDVLQSPLLPIIFSVSFYFICCFPFMIVDIYGKKWYWIQKYKIQPTKEVTWSQVYDTLYVTMWNHLFLILPMTIVQAFVTPLTVIPENAPGMWEFCWQITLFMLIFDLEYYVWHYVHHRNRFLYNHFHALHHRYYSPFSWVTQYLHPWELLSVGVFVTTTPWVIADCHPLTAWGFMVTNIIVSIEAHIGFDFPWSLHHWCPFGLWGGAPKHDMHHQRPQSNYQPFFTHFDRLFGTSTSFRYAGGVIENKKKII